MPSHLERSAASTAYILHPGLLGPRGATLVQLVQPNVHKRAGHLCHACTAGLCG